MFTLSSLVCGLSTTPTLLITMRVVQGLGAAAMFATSISLLRNTYSGRALATGMGVWGAVASGAAALGPLAGGILTQTLGWGWIFFVNIPVGVAAILLTARAVPAPQRRPASERAPGRGRNAAVRAVRQRPALRHHPRPCRRLEQHRDPHRPARLRHRSDAFVLRQRASDHPILDLALLRRPAFTAALIAIFVGEFTAYGFMTDTSIWLQTLTGLSPLVAGLIILPNSFAAMVVSLMAGRWLGRFLPRYSVPAALVLVAAGALAQMGALCPRRTSAACPESPGSASKDRSITLTRDALRHLPFTAKGRRIGRMVLIRTDAVLPEPDGYPADNDRSASPNRMRRASDTLHGPIKISRPPHARSGLTGHSEWRPIRAKRTKADVHG